MSLDIRGCGTALVTPFLDDGTLDVDALRSLVQYQLAEGIDFLVPCGTTGEAPTLEHEEYLGVVRVVAQEANRKVPVIAGAGGNNTRKICSLVQDIQLPDSASQQGVDSSAKGLATANAAREQAAEAKQERDEARESAKDAHEAAHTAAQDARDNAHDIADSAHHAAQDAADQARQTAQEHSREAAQASVGAAVKDAVHAGTGGN